MSQQNRISKQILVGAWFPQPVAEQLQNLAQLNERSRGGELRLAVKHWLEVNPMTNSSQEENVNESQK